MKSLIVVVSLLAITSLARAADPALPPSAALEAISADGLLKHIKVLASDEFEGRAPGSKGEDLSVKYISEQFKALGLKPGNPNGSYTQEVPLAGIKTTPSASNTFLRSRWSSGSSHLNSARGFPFDPSTL